MSTKDTFFANKKIEILFVVFPLYEPLPPGLPANLPRELEKIKKDHPWAKSAIKLYRRMPDFEQQWTEIGMAASEAQKADAITDLRVKIDPDAHAHLYPGTYTNEQGERVESQEIIIDLGKIM